MAKSGSGTTIPNPAPPLIFYTSGVNSMGCRLLTGYLAVGTRLLCYWVRPRRLDVSSLSRLKGARAMTSKHEDIDLQSEVAKQLDLSVIRYSRVWEDHRTLSQGLQIREDQDVVVSITR